MGKSYFFVRTQIDNDRRSEKRKHGKKFNEEKMLKEIKNNCVECLKNPNCGEEKVFLVSSYHPQKWDFDRLQTAIMDHLPSIQKESLALSLRTHSKVVLKQKIKILKGRVWMVAAVSVEKRFGFWPSSKYIDEKPIRDIVDSYRSQMEFPAFGSEEFNMLTNKLRRRLRRFYISQNDDLPRWLKSFDRANKYKIKTYTKYIVTNKPLPFIYYFLNLILDEMETTALDIIDEMAKKACVVYDDSD
ncbi:interferon-inducible GTPase 5-like [Paramuricea clavata]|uniref:Interferon-inducible GTPase 5-like n=1 Tax=Paramuricea clavata TaxID=317549 RepID=A0A7D9LMX2_PARCT|nr:interferon-inducible GTPase 5-like [Paramuricea clavata]